MPTGISISATGLAINATATSQTSPLPTVAGAIPKYCRIAATQPCWVKLGLASAYAVSGDILVQPADSLVVRTAGMTHVSALALSSAGVVSIAPVDE